MLTGPVVLTVPPEMLSIGVSEAEIQTPEPETKMDLVLKTLMDNLFLRMFVLFPLFLIALPIIITVFICYNIGVLSYQCFCTSYWCQTEFDHAGGR
jgi:hypothetical protein